MDSHDTDRLSSIIVNPERNYDRQAGPRDNPSYKVRKPNKAEWEILKFIDDVYSEGLKSARILHGKGAGILNDLVNDILKNDKRIRDFADAPPDHGGGGVTVFFFK